MCIRDRADPSSFRSAIYTACKIYNNRISYEKNNSNPLKVSDLKSVKK